MPVQRSLASGNLTLFCISRSSATSRCTLRHSYGFSQPSPWAVDRRASTKAVTGRDDKNLASKSFDPLIFPESLSATLWAHRAANEAAKIRRILSQDSYRAETLKRPRISYHNGFSASIEDLARGRGHRKKLARRKTKPEGSDYQGTSIMPTNVWQKSEECPPVVALPWLQELEDQPSMPQDPLQRLDAEVRAFERFISPTTKERDAFLSVYHDVQKTAGLEAEKVKIIGSQASGLARVLSDIDINIGAASRFKSRKFGERGPSPTRPKVRKELKALLSKLHRDLNSRPDLFRTSMLMRPKVPLVQGTHIPTGIKLEVQCSQDVNASLQYTQNYLNAFPALRPLHLAIKHALHMRGLGSTKTAGLGSYAILNMIVASLKLHEGRYDRLEAGRPLLDFLDFYSGFDTYAKGIAVDPVEIFDKTLPLTKRNASTDRASETRDLFLSWKRQGRMHEPYMMWLQDPANPTNDLGAGCRSIKHVQATFKDCATKIRENMERYKEHDSSGKQTVSLLAPLLSADYRRLLQLREGIEMAESRNALDGQQTVQVRRIFR